MAEEHGWERLGPEVEARVCVDGGVVLRWTKPTLDGYQCRRVHTVPLRWGEFRKLVLLWGSAENKRVMGGGT